MTISQIADLPILKVSETKLNFNFLVYGDSGTGKTRLAGSAIEVADLNPILLLDVEGGTLTLRSTYPGIDTIRIDSWAKLQRVYDILKLGQHGYKTIIVDSLTEVQKLGMDHTMDTRHGDDELAVPEIKEWNINIEQTRKFVRLCRDLENVNTIFTALVRVDTDKRSGLARKKPMLSGKVADEVAGFLDIVTYLYVEEVNGESIRILLTGTRPGTVAKDRSNALPLQIANPTMSTIYQLINGKVTEDVQA